MSTPVTEQAAALQVEATSRALHLPTVRQQAGALAEAALRDRLTHLAYLAEVLSAELDDRDARRRERRIHEARFPRLKHLADFDLAAAPTVDPAMLATLERGEWIASGQPVVLLGDSGTGKSHLLIGLGMAACQRGLRVRYTTAAALVNELAEASDERTLSRVVARYGRLDLLCLDEFGYVHLDPRGAELLFQVLTEREERASVAVASNAPFSEWGQTFADPRLAAAVVDRLTFRAHIIETGSESYRLRVTTASKGGAPDELIMTTGGGVRGRSAGCPAPPARIRTSALTHTAPALSPDGKSLRRPRMEDSDAGPEFPAQCVQALPGEVVPLGPPPEDAQPQPPQEPHEPRQRRSARRHRVVAKPPPQYPPEPPTRHLRIRVHPLPQLGLDGLQRAAHSLRHRLAPQPEAPVPLCPAVMREPEKVERLRSSFPTLRTVRRCEPPELQQARLLRVHFQSEAREPLPHCLHESLRIAAVLKPQDEIIGVPHEIRLAPDHVPQGGVDYAILIIC